MITEKWKWLVEKFGDKATIAAFTALIVAVGGQFASFRQDNRVEFRELAREYREEVNRLRSVEQLCLQMELSLTKQMDGLRSKMILLESSSQDLPFPHWLKSNGTAESPGVMLSINRAYEDQYLIPIGKSASDYIGKTDVQFWGEETGERYWSGDMQVIASRAPIDKYEVDPLRKEDSIRVIKYPRTLGSRVIGIGGMVIPDNKK